MSCGASNISHDSPGCMLGMQTGFLSWYLSSWCISRPFFPLLHMLLVNLEPQIWHRQFALLSLPLVVFCMERASVLKGKTPILESPHTSMRKAPSSRTCRAAGREVMCLQPLASSLCSLISLILLFLSKQIFILTPRTLTAAAAGPWLEAGVQTP